MNGEGQRERDTHTKHELKRGREREGDTESAAGSERSAQSLMWGSIPQTMRS